MIFLNKSKSKINDVWKGIKSLVDNIIADIDEAFGPKLKPIKIKNDKKKK